MTDKNPDVLKVSLPAAEESEEDLFDYYYDDPGDDPGTLYIEKDAVPPSIVVIDYNEHSALRVALSKPEDCIPYLDSESISWIDLQGLGNEATLRRMGDIFHLHPLLLEDVVNVPQRPKIDEYEDQMVIIAQMVTPNEDGDGFWIEQVSLILGKSYLLTVQEEPEHDSFEIVRQRIRFGRGVIRQRGADYLAYALIDSIIDGFFPVLENYGELIDELEEEVVINPTRQTLKKIYKTRRQLLALRRCIWPQRDAINALIRDGGRLISPEISIYLRDCSDHAIQVLDIVETYRELTSGLMDVYLSSLSNKMNEIVKLLTIISTIFIPLTFIAGVYGMNFNTDKSPWNMPELNWAWGYPIALAVMAAIAIVMVFFFHRRGWFDNSAITLKDD